MRLKKKLWQMTVLPAHDRPKGAKERMIGRFF